MNRMPEIASGARLQGGLPRRVAGMGLAGMAAAGMAPAGRRAAGMAGKALVDRGPEDNREAGGALPAAIPGLLQGPPVARQPEPP